MFILFDFRKSYEECFEVEFLFFFSIVLGRFFRVFLEGREWGGIIY